MKFYDKHPQLREKGFLAKVLANTVFSTMSLENQQVPIPKVEQIVLSLLKEQELKAINSLLIKVVKDEKSPLYANFMALI